MSSYVDDLFLSSLPVPITAVDLKPTLMGQLAARVLAEVVEGRASPGRLLRIPTLLHARASTTRR